jgi:mRNA-degrading endonuclease RelE of RelBE toxin-antitoxin system
VVTVVVTPEALEQINQLPRRIIGRVWELIDRLRSWPNVSGCKPLRGSLAGHFRLRTGDYRVQFTVQTTGQGVKAARRDYIITVEKVGHRDGFYGE